MTSAKHLNVGQPQVVTTDLCVGVCPFCGCPRFEINLAIGQYHCLDCQVSGSADEIKPESLRVARKALRERRDFDEIEAALQAAHEEIRRAQFAQDHNALARLAESIRILEKQAEAITSFKGAR